MKPLQNVAELVKTIAAHRQAAVTVCLRRASEQASPLTRAAKIQKKEDKSPKKRFCVLTAY